MLLSSRIDLPSSQPYGLTFSTVNGRISIRFDCEELTFIGLVPPLDRNCKGSGIARIEPEGSEEPAANPLRHFDFNIERLPRIYKPLLHLKSAPLQGNAMIAAASEKALDVEPRERLHT